MLVEDLLERVHARLVLVHELLMLLQGLLLPSTEPTPSSAACPDRAMPSCEPLWPAAAACGESRQRRERAAATGGSGRKGCRGKSGFVFPIRLLRGPDQLMKTFIAGSF